MPKPIARSKTRKAVAKRFKITGRGKVLRAHSSRRHLLSSKSGKRKRRLSKGALVDRRTKHGSRQTCRSRKSAGSQRNSGDKASSSAPLLASRPHVLTV